MAYWPISRTLFQKEIGGKNLKMTETWVEDREILNQQKP